MIPPKIVNPNAKQTQNFAIGVQCVFIKISGATSSHRPRAAEELRLAAGRLLVALGRVGDLLFRAKHLFVTAIGSTSTRHWRQDSRPNRRQREAGGKCGGFHHLGPVLIDEPVKRPRPSGGRNRGHDYLCHYRRGPNFWPL